MRQTQSRILLNYAANKIRLMDISDFALNDPGYEEYVACFNEILISRNLPLEASFDIRETISAAWYGVDFVDSNDLARYRRYRVFTNAVGISIGTVAPDIFDMQPVNYFLITLIEDAYKLEDYELLHLYKTAFQELHNAVIKCSLLGVELPYISMAQIIVEALCGSDGPKTNALMNRLAIEARQVKDCLYASESQNIWDANNFNQFHKKWGYYVTLAELRSPDFRAFIRQNPAFHPLPCDSLKTESGDEKNNETGSK